MNWREFIKELESRYRIKYIKGHSPYGYEYAHIRRVGKAEFFVYPMELKGKGHLMIEIGEMTAPRGWRVVAWWSAKGPIVGLIFDEVLPTLEDAYKYVIEMLGREVPQLVKRPMKQFKLSDFMYALIPLAGIFIIGKAREHGY